MESPRTQKRKRATDPTATTGRTNKAVKTEGYDEELGFDPFNPHSGLSKEERKMARMIRNRCASACSPSSDPGR